MSPQADTAVRATYGDITYSAAPGWDRQMQRCLKAAFDVVCSRVAARKSYILAQ